MPVYVKDKSIGTSPVSFTVNVNTEWQYYANQDKRTSRGLLSSGSNLEAVSLYGPNALPEVDQTATPQHIFTPPFSQQNSANSSIEFDLQYPTTATGGINTDRICTIQGSNSLIPADWQEVGYFNGQDIKTQTVTQEILNLDIGNKRFGTNGDGNSSGFRRFGQFGGVPDKFENYLFFDRDDSSFRSSVFNISDISELSFFITSGRSGLANAATDTEDGVKWQFGSNYGVTDPDYSTSGPRSLLVYLVKQVGSVPSPSDTVTQGVRAQGRDNQWSRIKFDTNGISGTHYFIFTKQSNTGDEKRHAVCAIQGIRHRIANFAASQRVKLDFDPQGGLNSISAATNNARPFLANYDLSRKYKWYRIGVKGPTANNIETTGSIINWVTKKVTGLTDDREGIDNWFPPQQMYVKSNSWKPVKQVFIKKDNSWVNVWPDSGQGAATLPPEQEGGGVFINNPDDAPVTSLGFKGFDDYENGLFGRRYSGDWNDNAYFFTAGRRTGETNTIQKWDRFSSNAYNYSWEWQGYAKIGTSGNYNIRINSDDSSAVFFGDGALSSSPANNTAWISYLGHHGADGYRTSNSRYLTAGELYPIRIRFGQWHKGPSEFNFQVKPPNSAIPAAGTTATYSFYYHDGVVDDPNTVGPDRRYHVYVLQNGRYERTGVFALEADARAAVATNNNNVSISFRYPTAYAYQLGGTEANMDPYTNTGKYRVVRNSNHVSTTGEIASGQLTTGNGFTPPHVWAQLAQPYNVNLPPAGIVEDQIFDTLAQAQARVAFLNSQQYQRSLDGYYFEHPDFDLVHVGQGFRKVPARTGIPREGVISTESTDNSYPLPVLTELSSNVSIADGKIINNTVDVGGGTGTISASRGIGTGNNPSMMPLIRNYQHNEYSDNKAGSMIRDCAIRGLGVNDTELNIMGLKPNEVDFSTTDITVRIQCRPRGPFALGVLRVNLDDDYFTGKSYSQWFRNLEAVRKWAVVKHTGYVDPFSHEYFDVSNVDPKVGVDVLNIRGELLNSLNWQYQDVFFPYPGLLAFRQLVSKEFTVTKPAENEVLIPFVTDFGDWVGGDNTAAATTGMDRVRCEMTYEGFNIANENLDGTLPVLTEINFDSHTSYSGATAPSILPIIFPVPPALVVPPNYNDEDDDNEPFYESVWSPDPLCPEPTYDPFNTNTIDNDDRDLFSDWDSGWDGTNSGVSVNNACTFNGNSFDFSLPPSTSSDNGGGSSGGNDTSSSSGDGCVIATHALSTGAFRNRDRANAIDWCEKNLHGKWWGETMRRGYRYLGRSYISEGKAETVYDEFKECMEWANGKRPFELRIATRYFYRVAQTFIVGLFVRDK
tara:strand:- start:701 stop:4690 length:3990 start_codon:yes stop_codon:yes gene_type:complete